MKLIPRRLDPLAFHKWRTIKKEHAKPLPIVSSAAVASSGVVGGRIIPLLILDASDRPELDEIIHAHEYLPPGDVTCQWGQLEDSKDCVALYLDFVKPIETLIIIEFSIANRGGLVDQILTSRILYIQTGKAGDRFLNTENAPRISVEIPDTDFFKTWDKIFFKSTVKHMRTNGLNRHEAKRAARQHIEQWRGFGKVRV